jgi:hypothetical protein
MIKIFFWKIFLLIRIIRKRERMIFRLLSILIWNKRASFICIKFLIFSRIIHHILSVWIITVSFLSILNKLIAFLNWNLDSHRIYKIIISKQTTWDFLSFPYIILNLWIIHITKSACSSNFLFNTFNLHFLDMYLSAFKLLAVIPSLIAFIIDFKTQLIK